MRQYHLIKFISNELDKRYHEVPNDQYDVHVVLDEHPNAPNVDDAQCVPSVDVQYDPNGPNDDHNDDGVDNVQLHN